MEVQAQADTVEVVRLTPRGLAALVAAGEMADPAGTPPARFPLGGIVATPGALATLAAAGQKGGEFLARHQAGDWGDFCPDDHAENEFCLERGFRLLSSYTLKDGGKIWVITDADRGATPRRAPPTEGTRPMNTETLNDILNNDILNDTRPEEAPDALTAQALGLVGRLRLDGTCASDGRTLPALGVTEKQVWALCGGAIVAALLALAGEVRALRLALCRPRQP